MGRAAIGSGSTVSPFHGHVTSVDNLGNGSQLTWTFEMRATSKSLMANIDRGFVQKFIKDKDVYLRLRVYMLAAAVAHDMRNHQSEWSNLSLMIKEIRRYRGTKISTAYADKMIAWAQETIDQKR